MTVDVNHVRRTLHERIARGASLSEIEALLRMSRGLGQRQREALWAGAARYDPRRMTVRQVDAARRFLSRTVGGETASANGRHDGRATRKPAAARPAPRRKAAARAASANGRPARTRKPASPRASRAA
jgi:hypothetical protein